MIHLEHARTRINAELHARHQQGLSIDITDVELLPMQDTLGRFPFVRISITFEDGETLLLDDRTPEFVQALHRQMPEIH